MWHAYAVLVALVALGLVALAAFGALATLGVLGLTVFAALVALGVLAFQLPAHFDPRRKLRFRNGLQQCFVALTKSIASTQFNRRLEAHLLP